MSSRKYRFEMARSLPSRWKGFCRNTCFTTSPICLVVWLKPGDTQSAEDFVQSLPKQQHIRVVLVSPSVEHPLSRSFPINLLRNLGIRNAITTHIAVMDIDLIPSGMFRVQR